MGCSFGHAVASTGAFGSDGTSFVLRCSGGAGRIDRSIASGSYLLWHAIDGVLILAIVGVRVGIGHGDLTIVLHGWVHHHLAIGENVDLVATVWIVLLPIVSSELVLVLEEGVLVALRST